MIIMKCRKKTFRKTDGRGLSILHTVIDMTHSFCGTVSEKAVRFAIQREML